MKVTTGEIKAALRQRKRGSSQAPGPAKRARQEGPSGTDVAAVGTVRAPPTGGVPAEERPAEKEVPAPAGTETEEGEIPAAAEAPAVVINLEEETPAAAAAPGAGRVTVAAAPSAGASLAVVGPEVRRAPVAVGGKKPEAERVPPTARGERSEAERAPPAARGERPAGKGPSAGTPTAEKKRDEPSGSSQRLERRTPRRPTEGARAGSGRPGPRLQSLQDPVQAAVMLAYSRTPESTEEVQGLSFGSLLDGIMISIVQITPCP